ncbi:hypothetical protein CsSME_00015421 [Camellia sinensis var. sinensis]
MARRSKPRSGTPSAKSASAPSPPPTTKALLVLSSSTISLAGLLSIASSSGSMNSRLTYTQVWGNLPHLFFISEGIPLDHGTGVVVGETE